MREAPPAVVSPLMLALMMVQPGASDASCCSSSATHPLPRGRPYSAERLSPSTSRVRAPAGVVSPVTDPVAVGVELPVAARTRPGAAASTLSAAASRRRPIEKESVFMSVAIVVENLSRRVRDADGELTILDGLSFEIE